MRGRLSGVLVSVAAVVLLGPAAVSASVIKPTTTADEYNTNAAACSLREAVESANTDSVTNADGCTQGSGADTIELAPGATYSLSIPSANPGSGLNLEGDLDISGGNLGITVPGNRGATIDGNGPAISGRVLEVLNLAPAISVVISNVNFTDGGELSPADPGGAIAVNGISQPHYFFIENSTISGNRAVAGGGVSIGNDTTAVLSRVTISGNASTVDAGGLASDGETTLLSATVTANTADSNGDTIGTGGGIVPDNKPVRMGNTIVAGNTEGGAVVNEPDCDTTSSPVVSLGFSLIGNLTGCEDYTPGPADLTGADPGLLPLAFNGGPGQTHALLPSSKAVDAGGACDRDARGVPASLSGGCDIGAYQRVTCGKRLVNVVGTEGADQLVGTAGRDGILGLGGKDSLKGLAGGDGLCGLKGKDVLKGGKGNDRLIGGKGKDKCVGGAGRKDRVKTCEKGGA